MKDRLLFFIFVLLLSIDVVYAATLHGKVYDLELNELNNVILEVNSTPKQRFVSRDGFYSFALNPGRYVITASYSPDGASMLTDQEEVVIAEQGEYVFDIFIMPSIDDPDYFENITINEPEVIEGEEGMNYVIPVSVIVGIAVLTAVWLILRKKKHVQIQEKTEDATEDATKSFPSDAFPSVEAVADSDLEMLLKILREEGGRMSQKDLRKKMPFSEAKVSLMISELEHKGVIEKIKKGRTNIVILKR